MQKRIKTNPVYSPYYQDQSRHLVIHGGAGCFEGDQLIETLDGPIKIKDLSESDLVLSMNHENNQVEYRRVIEVHKNEGPKLIRIKMKDGSIINVTPDHEFYYGGSYVKIKNILLSLQHGDMEKNT
jgi:uncharacterized protein involved in tolerance to divalent cations